MLQIYWTGLSAHYDARNCFYRYQRWCGRAIDQHKKYCFVFVGAEKDSLIYTLKARLPPTNTFPGASVNSSYGDLLPTHWTSPMLLGLLSFLKLFSLAEIPSLWTYWSHTHFPISISYLTSSGKSLPVHSVKNLPLNPRSP